ncbi:CobW family GTP-binding protein [Desulfosporosinus meridiei]|uniref:Putative GTPase, G3E family n=1 Tax=Desulfosporosinus meridiei (strain ATCC BAA-275 / DSM 13257 / KCTC 12902 / NCIMB 13706 / S10) TaxID=768704 RepID=J7ISQ6_DESMD|nr:GTP-binding protein [Desulfosporosinus meridiei]AFQ44887.1 putative GTPase, G3E family [Desulfosporosinus meridiei DSM 13257]
MTQLILLTGFLGTGKTTLMERLLHYYGDSPVGVIVNEFGEINIDARLLEKDGTIMRELSNGSIFCSCIKENFIKALIDMSSPNFEYLFIEASGLADPGNMQQILQTIEPYTVHPYHYSGSICVLDGEAFLELKDLLPAVGNQLTQAGVVLVNKEDLISPAIKAEIQAEVRKANIQAPIYFTSYCNIDINTLVMNLQPSKSASLDSTNTPENRPQTFIIKVLPSVTINELQGFLNFVAPYTYRIKGFVTVGDSNYSVSCVRSHMMIMPWPRDIPASEIVLISAVGIGLTGAIADGINMNAPKSIKL